MIYLMNNVANHSDLAMVGGCVVLTLCFLGLISPIFIDIYDEAQRKRRRKKEEFKLKIKK